MAQILLRNVFKVLPIVTFVYSFFLLYFALSILSSSEDNYFYFLFLVCEVYVNWAAIVVMSSNCSSAKTRSELKVKQDVIEFDILGYQDKCFVPQSKLYDDDYLVKKNHPVNEDFVSFSNFIGDDNNKVWYCPKCCLNCPPNCRHCPICSKCVLERDHHCLFLGACVSSQNMKHFIVILLYTGLVTMFVFNLFCVEMNLYEAVSNDRSLIMRHFFPISFAKWITGHEPTYNLIRIFILNTTASLTLFSFIFVIYHMYLVVTGKLLSKLQKNRRYPSGIKNIFRNFSGIFGDYGVLNFIVPLGFTERVLKKYF